MKLINANAANAKQLDDINSQIEVLQKQLSAQTSNLQKSSANIGAQAAGGRAMTATSSNGLSLMWEMVYIASSLRLPMVMTVVNRAVSGPLNIHNDHSDSMGCRDSGWIQLYSETNQEAYDNMLMAHRIAEHKDVVLPVMVCMDGFITSHAIENIQLEDDEFVKKFVGQYHPENYLLNDKKPIAVGPLDLQSYLFEHKRQQGQAMINAKQVILDVSKDFENATGRKYELFEKYMLDDAEVAIVVINSTAGTAKAVINELREKGIKAGLLKVRVYRPFPAEEIAKALSNVKAVAILDKADGLNAAGGPLFTDVTSALYSNNSTVKAINYIYGIGGRDVKTTDIEQVYDNLIKIKDTGIVEEVYNYLGVRE